MNHEKTGILRRAKRYQADIVTLVIRIFSAFCVVYTLLSITGFISDSSLDCDIRQTYSEDLYNAPANISLKELELLKVKVTEDPSIADALVKTVRVLCIIMTTPANHIKKAIHVKNTWGKRCNLLVFMSTKKDKYLPTIKLPVIEGKNHLWGKTKAAFQYIYQHYRSEAEWFLKADDDKFVIVENLRYLLSDYNSSDPVYFGHPNPQGYMTGGAGYVLSREALNRFVNQAVPNPSICRQDDEGTEDLEMGKCLDKVRVTGVDTRDSMTQFYPFDPETHLMAKYDRNSWDTYRDLYARNVLSSDCCAKHAVSFHCLSPGEMYYLDYVLYSLRPYGIIQNYHLTHNISFEDNRK